MLYRSFQNKKNQTGPWKQVWFCCWSLFCAFLLKQSLNPEQAGKGSKSHTRSTEKNREVIEKWKHSCTLHSFLRVFLKRQWAQTQFRYFCSLGQISLFPLTPSALQLPTSAEELALHIWLELQPKTASNWSSFYLRSNFFCGISAHLGQVEQKYWVKAKGGKIKHFTAYFELQKDLGAEGLLWFIGAMQ